MQKYYYYLYLLIFIFLALPMIKLGPARVEQLLLIVAFIILFFDDYIKRELDLKILIFLMVGAVILILVSKNSIYPKTDESGYFVKFLFVYPVAFYVGARALHKLGIKNIIYAFDFALLFYFVSWFIVMYLPVPTSILYEIVHLREFGWGAEFLPIQGTFYEAGALGIIVGSVLTLSILARYEFDIWMKDKRYNYLLYLSVIYMVLLSKNKTVWLAYIMVLIFIVIYKGYLMLTRGNFYYTQKIISQDEVLFKFSKVNATYVMIGAISLILTFFIYNSVASEPFITMQELQFKIENERGAQYAVSWDLIVESNYFGGYGLGFVEPYFTGLNIMGVGDGDGSINNIILDIWLQGSILGVIYLMAVFYFAFDSRLFLTITIPLYFFFFGLTNPIVAEEFFLFLGVSYGFAQMLQNDELSKLQKKR